MPPSPPENNPPWKSGGAAYLPYINSVEQQLGLPIDLLARVAFEESSFRTDVISSAGAVGMFQLMPEYFPGAGVNWQTDAETAGRYLLSLHVQFADWSLALAAYNAGPGTVRKYVRGQLAELPAETSRYVAQIAADTQITGSLV